jgi:hypothetical protein
MRWLGTISWLSLLLLTGCGIFHPSPDPLPCDCAAAEKETRAYTQQLFNCLEDNGVLRHQLKAERERR